MVSSHLLVNGINIMQSGGIRVDGRKLLIVAAVSRDDAVKLKVDKTKVETGSRNLYLAREGCEWTHFIQFFCLYIHKIAHKIWDSASFPSNIWNTIKRGLSFEVRLFWDFMVLNFLLFLSPFFFSFWKLSDPCWNKGCRRCIWDRHDQKNQSEQVFQRYNILCVSINMK